MKQETIKSLLAKHEAGTLTDEELDLLQRLTRRDEVVAGAERRAKAIVVRRRRAVAACVALCLVVAATGILVTRHDEQVPQMAQQTVPVALPDEEPAISPVETLTLQTAAVSAEKSARPSARRQKAKSTAKEPVVMCNSQCDADSVISDIWKFLTA